MGAHKKSNTNDSTNKNHRKQKRVSDILRDGRIGRDLELQDISDALHIRLPFIEAIEAGQYERLPGTTYAIGFIRAYADFLNLDSESVVAQFKIEAAELARRTELHFPEPLPGGRVPDGAIVFVCIVLAIVFYGAWMFISSSDKPVAEMVSDLPTNLAEMIGVNVDDTVETTEVTETEVTEAGVTETEVTETEVTETEVTETEVTEAGVIEAEIPKMTPNTVEEITVEEQDTALLSDPALVEASAEPVNENPAGALEAISEDVAPIASDEGENTPPVDLEAPIVEAINNSETSNVNTGVAVDPNVAVEEPVVALNSEAQGVEEENITNVNNPVEETLEASNEMAAEMVVDPTLDTASTNIAAATPIPSPPALPVVERAPRIYGEENVNARVVITANTPTWVEITAPSGELILTRLLGTNDSFRAPDVEGLTLVTGNAGGLDFTVDGKAVPPIGDIGSVRRDVSLNAESLQKGQAQ